jgi:hypothetical protein
MRAPKRFQFRAHAIVSDHLIHAAHVNPNQGTIYNRFGFPVSMRQLYKLFG